MNNLHFSANSLDNFLVAETMAGMWKALKALGMVVKGRKLREEMKTTQESAKE